MRSDDLLAAVFPAQVACQDNAPPGDIEVPDHPLVFETLRDCLTEAADLVGLEGVLKSIETGEIEVYARDTVQPSVFSHQILNAMPYAFLDDAPLEERRARAVSLRRALPEDSRDLGALDPRAIQEESENAWPRVRDADELHDALLTLGVLLETDLAHPSWSLSEKDIGELLGQLVAARRAVCLCRGIDGAAWVATERIPLALAAYPGAWLEPEPPIPMPSSSDVTHDEAVLTLTRGRVECTGPFTGAEMAQALGLSTSEVAIAIAQLEAEGLVLRGRFRPEATVEEFCNRRILARIHRSTIDTLRKQIEPVPAATFIPVPDAVAARRWRLPPVGGGRYPGCRRDAARLRNSRRGPGSRSCCRCGSPTTTRRSWTGCALGGEVVWGRPTRHPVNGNSRVPARQALTRTTPITLALAGGAGLAPRQTGPKTCPSLAVAPPMCWHICPNGEPPSFRR